MVLPARFEFEFELESKSPPTCDGEAQGSTLPVVLPEVVSVRWWLGEGGDPCEKFWGNILPRPSLQPDTLDRFRNAGQDELCCKMLAHTSLMQQRSLKLSPCAGQI